MALLVTKSLPWMRIFSFRAQLNSSKMISPFSIVAVVGWNNQIEGYSSLHSQRSGHLHHPWRAVEFRDVMITPELLPHHRHVSSRTSPGRLGLKLLDIGPPCDLLLLDSSHHVWGQRLRSTNWCRLIVLVRGPPRYRLPLVFNVNIILR